jgi:hypothetical protein
VAAVYEIGTNKPMFLGRDGIVKYELDAIEHERRTGYNWLGPYAATLLAKRLPGLARSRSLNRSHATRGGHHRLAQLV